MPPTRTIGPTIRATRLGFCWSDQHGSFIRFSTIGSRNFIELAPSDDIPKKPHTKEYRCWWETDGFLNHVPWLKNIRYVKRYLLIELDDHGNIIPRRR